MIPFLIALSIASCGELLGPAQSPAAYLLTSIAGRPAVGVELYRALGMPEADEGSESYVVADTLWLGRTGQGRRTVSFRHRVVREYGTPAENVVSYAYTYHMRFQFVETGAALRVRYDECHVYCADDCRRQCIPPGNEPVPPIQRAKWGALEVADPRLGVWHYEPAVPERAP